MGVPEYGLGPDLAVADRVVVGDAHPSAGTELQVIEEQRLAVVAEGRLTRARAGDEEAFRQMTDPYRREVQAHCYRMLGSPLGASEPSVKSALQRARATLRQAGHGGDRLRPPPGSAAERLLARRFARAFQADDVEGVIALVSDYAWLTMPPSPLQYQGRAAIASFLSASVAYRSALARPFRLLPTRANTQPAFGLYVAAEQTQSFSSAGLIVLTLEGERIAAITRFLGSDLASRFGLPQYFNKAHGAMH